MRFLAPFSSRIVSRYAERLCIWAICIVTALVTACQPKTDDAAPLSPGKQALLVVNEGLFNRNNSTLTYIDLDSNTARTDAFELSTGRRLGDTGNDVDVYGGKVYVVVNVSSTVAVLAKNDLRLLGIISLTGNGGAALQPRQIAFTHGKAWISCFSGDVVIIDTATLTETQRITAGRNPEGICVSGDYVAVACSGGLSFPNYDNRVFVYRAADASLVGSITVNDNPTTVVPGTRGEVWVYSSVFGQPNAALQRLDLASLSVLQTISTPPCQLVAKTDTLYCLERSPVVQIHKRAIGNNTQVVIPVNISGLQTPYGFLYDTCRREYWIYDARDYQSTGRIHQLDASGQPLRSFPAGLNPGAMVRLP